MMFHIWRHPKPVAANGFCIGQTDISVDKRKVKRLANKIQRFVRLHQLPKVIWVSPLQRSLKVGEILAQHGFQCNIAPALAQRLILVIGTVSLGHKYQNNRLTTGALIFLTLHPRAARVYSSCLSVSRIG